MTKMTGLLTIAALMTLPVASATIEQDFSALNAGDPARAVATIDPVLVGFEKEFAGGSAISSAPECPSRKAVI